MNLLGLAVSAGINIGLAALFLTLYSVFRKQPVNANVFFARHVWRDQNLKMDKGFTFQRLLPSAGWIKKSLQPSDDDIIASSALDSLVFLRIFIFCMRLFAISTILGVCILVPVNYTDTQVRRGNETDQLDYFTIANVKNGSNRLWVHFSALYILSIVAYCLLYLEYKHISQKRLEFINATRPQPDQFTALVRAIPREQEHQSYSESVEAFFARFYSSTYYTHQMAYSEGKISAMLHQLEELIKKGEELKKQPTSERIKNSKRIIAWFGPKVDPIEVNSQKIEDLHQRIREHQSALKKKELPTAFVSFKSRWGAAICAQTYQSSNPMIWVTEWAPEPRDVYWPNLGIPYSLLKFYSLGVWIAAFLLTVTYVIPTSLVQTLVQLDNLERWFPVVKVLLNFPGLNQIVTGYLPSLLLSLLLYVVPSIMLILSKIEGHISRSRQEREASKNFFYFLVGNVFFITVLSGSLLNQINSFISKPTDIPSRLAVAVPRQAAFFITYILTTGWAGFSLELLQLGAVVLNFIKVHIFGKDKVERSDVYSLPYYRIVPSVLLFILVGLMYSLLTPLLLPFLLVYFSFGYIVYRNQILNVYEPAYDSGGQMWPHVHFGVIFSLVLMQITFVGVFGVKGKATASLMTIPLPFTTLLFHNFCKQIFYPIFKNLPVENTMLKDLEDEKHGHREEMLQVLQTAYRHPTLQSINLFGVNNSNTEHLLA
ncbi:hypothetical protein O6H91_09G007100 [Diphasiastrum complanatum]|uniref:Uncharacterized protein n=1 Tax=Diphasiastrum complanatum TaxID=34168 RepID=A0ACC2CL38_DIPCM|nr:hypothetical protein O6H91_Y105200 [Diphasiastrum complanatum]KAJ7542697.1 hypothetical protein O6H91_09G007100 [Diphasiastrum complanatum]